MQQVEGIFDLPPSERDEKRWDVDLPLDERPWSIGLVVGASGSGKTTLARELWPDRIVSGHDWPRDKSLMDGFPPGMGIKDVTEILSSVGFNNPPAWLRPFSTLSNGEQFRATVARALAEAEPGAPVVLDEFTSVVDRTVARIGAAAIARTVRRRDLQFIALSCHYDVEEWLQPDWVHSPETGAFQWRSVQRRPGIDLEIVRADRSAWHVFKAHHYLSGDLSPSAQCYVALVDGRPAAFAAVVYFQHPQSPGWRGHRTVCLPDFQGVGIGNVLSEYVASLYSATGLPYRSTTANPAMIRHRARSPVWLMERPPEFHSRRGRDVSKTGRSIRKGHSATRALASFRFVGAPRSEDARGFGVLK